ncbi:Small-conductance mechanosensitive channel [Falsiruegeria litorea R37]|uniref:Small-conductance mechanosensitive channel n=1 Tax=Falsiruegeria litorea R37 TaxID=1200284 RepID=A0A1Y5SE42_9RHOB|nr:mechanosensitive ion channel family protein [Falsiruegeria litorea]SLN38604.1 Small-conductance mechanosensitive channel [Falsiruegeria litorea R37]
MNCFIRLILTFRVLIVLSLVAGFVSHSPTFAQETGEQTPPQENTTQDVSDLVTRTLAPEVTPDDLSILMVPLTAAEMAQVVEGWQAHVRSQLEQLSYLNLDLNSASDAKAETLRAQLAEVQQTTKAYLANYQASVTGWQDKGATPEEVKPYQDYAYAAASGALRTTDPKTLFSAALDWLTDTDGGLGFLFSVLTVLLSIWALMFAARLARRMTDRGLTRVPSLSKLLKSFISTAVFWAVMVLGVLVVLGLFGVNVTPLFAVFGGLSFILGFALQETLGNLASGLMIMVLKPFDTGDYIQVGSSSGFVDEMSVVSTKIRTFDNQIIVVPNSKIWGDIITNVSASETRRVDLVFGIGYSDDAALAIEVLTKLVAQHDLCLKDPAAEIFVGELGESSVNIFCRPWTKNDDYWTVFWDLTGQAKIEFDAVGISIPFPQRDVHLIPVEGAAQ